MKCCSCDLMRCKVGLGYEPCATVIAFQVWGPALTDFHASSVVADQNCGFHFHPSRVMLHVTLRC